MDSSKHKEELMFIVMGLQNHLMQLQSQILELKTTNADLEARIRVLEEKKGATSTYQSGIESEAAEFLFRACTPVQHAFIQLIFEGKNNAEIGARLGTTEGSIKTRFRHICSRLHVRGRAELEAVYRSIHEGFDADEYKEIFHIPKDWAEKYGELSFGQAKKKLNGDPFHTLICETRHRGVHLPKK